MELDVREIRELAKKFTPEEIEGCITEQLSAGKNVCLVDNSTERIINELAKAEFVKWIDVAEALYSIVLIHGDKDRWIGDAVSPRLPFT